MVCSAILIRILNTTGTYTVRLRLVSSSVPAESVVEFTNNVTSLLLAASLLVVLDSSSTVTVSQW